MSTLWQHTVRAKMEVVMKWNVASVRELLGSSYFLFAKLVLKIKKIISYAKSAQGRKKKSIVLISSSQI